ncbi:MAG: hypothetical protein IT317_01340 [Anaerolineales bacterium]|nr:hypothetical protein [Anaerolineales bacterium]
MTQSSRGAARPPLTLLQIVVIIGIAAALLIMLDFNRRQAEAQRLEADRDHLATEVADLAYANAVLATQVAYATTDAAVIAWAHEQGKLVQPDEVLVVPIVPTAAATSAPAQPPPPPAPETWVLWWNLFFDLRPPITP